MRPKLRFLLILFTGLNSSVVLFVPRVALLTAFLGSTAQAEPYIQIPKYRLEAHDLAIIVNDNDPLSIQIANYYRERRGIPLTNVVHVRIDPKRVDIPVDYFSTISATVERQVPNGVQAFALTWARPYRVGCMSVTAAFTAGYDTQLCEQSGCRRAAMSKLFDADTVRPFYDRGLRPTMALAALNFEDAKALIDRGIRADGSDPLGTVYMLSTSDHNRNVRSPQFEEVVKRFGSRLRVENHRTDTLRDKPDVLTYFTGRQSVVALDTLRFLPGAVADHLTSFGGQLTNSSQMSSLRWLEAGATASYGTVVEPCNIPMKFPAPEVFLDWYLRGATVIEAYWKSVAWPWEGVFVGEPLASPFGGVTVHQNGDVISLKTNSLRPGTYRVWTSQSAVGPFEPQRWVFPVRESEREFRLPALPAAAFALKRE